MSRLAIRLHQQLTSIGGSSQGPTWRAVSILDKKGGYSESTEHSVRSPNHCSLHGPIRNDLRLGGGFLIAEQGRHSAFEEQNIS